MRWPAGQMCPAPIGHLRMWLFVSFPQRVQVLRKRPVEGSARLIASGPHWSYNGGGGKGANITTFNSGGHAGHRQSRKSSLGIHLISLASRFVG